jgi:undecaprenyl phosphate-alpha-L-ara4FN deformylase
MPVGLKIDIFTREGLQETLPALLDVLSEYKLEATFFPALGPDPARNSGLVGRLLDKAPDLDIETEYAFLSIQEQGHELGAVAYDVAQWRRHILERDAAWTREQLRAGVRAFEELFDERPHAVAVPDFLINADTPLLEAELGFDYACDTRGLSPYFPVSVAGPSRCPQIPVTLPRIEEAVAAGESLEDVHQYLFMESQKPLQPGHLFNFTLGDTAHLGVLEKLIVMWMGSQRELVPVRHLLEQVKREDIPLHQAGLIKLGDQGPVYAAQGEPVKAGP